MASEQGFSNQKKKGKAQFKTIHSVNSDAFAESTIPKYLYDVTSDISVDAVVDILGSNGQVEYWKIEMVAHTAVAGNVLRMTTSIIPNFEFDVISVIDADHFLVLPIAPSKPTVGDLGKIMSWVTGKADADGNPVVSVPPAPVKFMQDGVLTDVSQDTLAPGNNVPLPVTDIEGNSYLYSLDQRVAGSLTPIAHDEIVTTYVGATTDIASVTYKLAGVTVAILTLTYDGSNRLINVVRT